MKKSTLIAPSSALVAALIFCPTLALAEDCDKDPISGVKVCLPTAQTESSKDKGNNMKKMKKMDKMKKQNSIER